MDPMRCMMDCLDKFDTFKRTNDRDDKIELMENLLQYSNWINRGGFDPPAITRNGESHSALYWFDWIMDRI